MCKRKLTQEQAEEIRRLVANGSSKKDVADAFKVSAAAVHLIVNNKTYVYTPEECQKRKDSARWGHLEDPTGKRYGRLTVVERVEPDRTRRAHNARTYRCLCDCGAETILQASQFIRGVARSCGCLHRELLTKRQMKRPFESLYNVIVASARKRDYACDLTYDEFLEFTHITECHYCGEPVSWSAHSRHGDFGLRGYNLDRKDNDKGYSTENCVVCCGRCNRGKGSDFTYEQWMCMTQALRQLERGTECCYSD